jgi:hypothetical protein
MVINKRCSILFLEPLILCISLFLICAPLAEAQITYSVNKEWVKIWINNDGSIDMQCNVTMTYLSGSPQGIVTLGMPKGGFQVQYAKDLAGSNLQFNDVSQGDFYGIDVYLTKPIIIGSPITFLVYAVVPEMVHPDTTNPGNVGMQFYPSTFLNALGTTDLRLAITLPEGVNSTSVKYPTDLPFDNVFLEGNNLVVYWERTTWSPTQQFRAGVSFPEKYVSLAPSGLTFDFRSILLIAFVVILVIAIIGVIITRKAAYMRPQISVEALGAMRSLTAVEAGVVLDQKPVRVLTMILYGLLLKRIATVTETDPLIKLKRLEIPVGQPSPALRYYEIDYLKAMEPDGTLNETALARTYLGLVDTVNQKLRGYSRKDTVNYYQSIVNQAWTQVTQAGTPELKGDALDKNIEWLLADEKFDERFKNAFPPNIIILPMPGWWWYWGGPHFPTGQQRIPPTTPTQVKPIPGQDFANNVVRGLETTSNNIVKNVQDFANRLVPAQAAKPPEQSVRGRSSCVCACHACACACACVSCACACAGGGAR